MQQPPVTEDPNRRADDIQLYSGDVEVLAKSMDYIQKTAASILGGLQAHSTDTGPEELAA